MSDTNRKASIHRFRDTVAIDIGTGATNYLSPADAFALSRALKAAAGDVRARPFGESQFETFRLESTRPREFRREPAG